MESVRDSLHVFIDNTIAALAAGTRVNATNMTDHQMAVVAEDGIVLSEGTVGTTREQCFIVQRHGTTLVWSPPIRRNHVISYAGQDYTAPVQQITHIGYDGASATATIEAISDNLYIARIFIQDELMFQDKLMPKFGIYTSDAAALNSEVCDGLALNLTANFRKEPTEERIRVERLCSDAGALITGAGASLAFTYNSTTVTITGGTLTNVAAGDYVRIANAITSPVYGVSAIVTNASITLDQPYQGATATITIAAGVLNRVTNAQYILAAVRKGIQLRAVARRFAAGTFKYYNKRFRVSLQDFGTTAVTYTTGANEGTGYGARIMELEWFGLGTEGFIERLGVPAPALPRQIAVETNTYATLKIVTDNPVGATAVHSPVAARNEILVAGYENPLGAPGTFGAAFYQNAGGADTGVIDVLNTYLAGIFAAYTPA